jgi:hypothetical protein
VPLENVHPLQSGLLRLKHPSERRPGLPRENPVLFWPRFAWETCVKHVRLAGVIGKFALTAWLVARDPASKTYMDQALTPVADDDDEKLALFTKTAGGSAAVSHVRRVAQLTRPDSAA